MSQTTEAQTTPPTSEEVIGKVNESIAALQEAQKTVVEGAQLLAEHVNDPTAHGAAIPEVVEQQLPTPVMEGTSLKWEKKDGTIVAGPVDLKGAPGQDGADGETGPRPEHRWEGTKLFMQNSDGSWPAEGVDLKGDKGDTGKVEGLSDSVDSDNSTTPASSKAVKTAYDKAVSAQETADAANSTAQAAQSAAETADSKAQAAQNAAQAAQTTAENIGIFSGSTSGLVPASDGDATKVLLGDGTWGSAVSVDDGAAAMTISEDLHLTADSPRTLVLTASASALSVCLPDTATLPEGTTFHIIVRPLEDIQLCDFSGQSIKAYPVLSANAAIRVQLVDASTGLWALWKYELGSTSAGQGKPGLNIGDLTVFSSGTISQISIVTLSETKAIVCYSDTANSYYATAVVLSISGTRVTVGDATVLDSEHRADYLSADTLSENKVLACYGDNSNINVRTLTISGISIVLGGVFTFYRSHDGIRVKVLSENKAIVVYYFNNKSNLSYLYAKGITIDGDNITFGSEYDIDHNPNKDYYEISKIFSLSKDKVVLFNNEGNSCYGYILVISETEITEVNEKYLPSNLNLNGMIQLSPDKYVAINTKSSGPLVSLIDISNTTINYSEPIQIDNYSTSSGYLIALSLTKFLVFYKDSSDKSNTYKVRLCEVSGTSIAIRGTIYSDLVQIPYYISLLSPELPTIIGVQSGTPSTTGIMYFV